MTFENRSPVTQVLCFFALSYTITWALFISASLIGSAFRLPMIFLGSVAPSLVAVGLTARARGLCGVKELLRRLLIWRVRLRWCVFALGYFAAVKLCVAVAYRAMHGVWPHFGDHFVPTILALIIVAGVTGGPLGEEIGWRGYALPRLTARFGSAIASIVLGVVWSCWHLPLFLLAVGGDQFGQSFPTYLLQVTALSVAIAFLMGNAGGSLLLAVLMHSAINQTKDLVPSRVVGADNVWALSSSTVAWLTVAVLWLCAGYFLTRMPRRAHNQASHRISTYPTNAPHQRPGINREE